MSNTNPDVEQDARAWQNVKKRWPGTTREALARIELGDRVADALWVYPMGLACESQGGGQS